VKAVVYEGTRKVGVEEVEDAAIEEPTDVLLRITSSALCGTDLHMYDGHTGAEPGLALGHEPLGVVSRDTCRRPARGSGRMEKARCGSDRRA
jgi:glutathione-independent formaldehyde dehydrogenase